MSYMNDLNKVINLDVFGTMYAQTVPPSKSDQEYYTDLEMEVYLGDDYLFSYLARWWDYKLPLDKLVKPSWDHVAKTLLIVFLENRENGIVEVDKVTVDSFLGKCRNPDFFIQLKDEEEFKKNMPLYVEKVLR